MQIDKTTYSKKRPTLHDESLGVRIAFDLALPRGRDILYLDHIVEL